MVFSKTELSQYDLGRWNLQSIKCDNILFEESFLDMLLELLFLPSNISFYDGHIDIFILLSIS